MSNFMEEFLKMYGGDVTKELSSNLGIKKDIAAQMIPIIAPMILSGLKRQMDQHGGSDTQARANRVNHILDKYGNPSVLEDISGELQSRAQNKEPDPRLGGLLGDSGVMAANTLSKQLNIDPSVIMKAITMLAPVILGALSSKRDTDLGNNGIASLIDQNGDNTLLDNVAGFLIQGLAGKGSGQGLFENLLQGMMQPKCPKCGRAIEKGNDFCPGCGTRL
jgi:hypothetical protein